MKKKFLAVGLVLLFLCVTGCKEKRCHCITRRSSERLPAHSFEPLDGHKSCSELNKEWMAADSSLELINKECTEEE